MLSGLFDEFPGIQVILGHLRDGLPFMLPRLQHRLDEQREGEQGLRRKRCDQSFWQRGQLQRKQDVRIFAPDLEFCPAAINHRREG
jgi:hypothetical protein